MRICLKITGLALALIGLAVYSARGQNADLSLQVQVNSTLANSQSINVQSLLSSDGKGPSLFQLSLKNQSPSEHANDLYFEIIVRSDKIGRIAHIYQVNGQPFSLGPGQLVHATNNNLSDGLPGVEELIQFDGDLTSKGREFVNNLKGGTTLPPDRYSVEINVYQASGRQHKVATASAEIGSNIVENTHDFYLLSPGDVVNSGATVANPYPSFQWQGGTGSSYRLILVESRANESPQSLLEGAASTEARQLNGSSSGSLVDYEMLDINLNQSNFQYPSSGVQHLEAGQTYYWRIISRLETSSGRESRESEIWSFTLEGSGKGSNTTADDRSAEVARALKSVLGDRLEQFTGQNFSFDGIQINGENLQGGQAIQKLMELSRRAEQDDISIVIENQ